MRQFAIRLFNGFKLKKNDEYKCMEEKFIHIMITYGKHKSLEQDDKITVYIVEIYETD